MTTPSIPNDFNMEYDTTHLQRIDQLIRDPSNIDVLRSVLHMHSTLAMIVE